MPGVGGLSVIELDTSARIYEIPGVRSFAHLEFAKGYAVFDVGRGEGLISRSDQDVIADLLRR